MQRREFVKFITVSTGAALLSSCAHGSIPAAAAAGRRVLVLAFDGLDPRIVESLISSGRLPNFARLAEVGSLKRIATSTPPHTPVAFSSIISGADPGTHQIFDFIHRDANPASLDPIRPYFSTADTNTSENQWALSLGNWRLPLSSGAATQLLRRGEAFWDHLVARGIDTQVYYLPSNYPPQVPEGPGHFRAISGMGTPDLLGTYGEFTLFTPDAPRRGRSVGGGRFVRLKMDGDRGRAELVGPPNFLRGPDDSGRIPATTLTFDIVRDPVHRVAKIRLSDRIVLLNEGEWSEWLPVEFPTGVPGNTVLRATGAPTSVWGMVRLYAKEVYPKFVLYVSPINIDPSRPMSPITVPAGFGGELARCHGRFCTLGIPEDTKALSHGALDEAEFLSQAEVVMEERREQFQHALARFQRGCLFFYFGASDLLQHMFWRDRDPQHPGRVPEQAERFGDVVDEVYVAADQIVGEALRTLKEEDTLLVFSDHGFTSFRRGFHLNTWLKQNGYIHSRPGTSQRNDSLFTNVAWSGTKAYGLGMNGLYINAAGREKHGSVRSSDKRSLLEQIRDELLEVRDVDGTSVIRHIDLVEDIYPGADPNVAPDMIIGYNDGYRASWETVLGEMPSDFVVDNLDRWSGTHLIAADIIPGVFLSNRRVTVAQPSILDIAPSILGVFGVSVPSEMTGRNLFMESECVLA